MLLIQEKIIETAQKKKDQRSSIVFENFVAVVFQRFFENNKGFFIVSIEKKVEKCSCPLLGGVALVLDQFIFVFKRDDPLLKK